VTKGMLEVTDHSLFGAAVHNHISRRKPKCGVCGKPQRLRRIGGRIVSNICAALGACGECLMKGRT
jgi:hypothetical protein